MPPPGLLIRAARPDDAEAFTALMNQPGVRRGTMRLPFQSLAITRQGWDRLGPNDLMLLAFLQERLAGSASLHHAPQARRRHAAHIGMAVDDAHVGRGIGSALLDALLDAADNWLDLKRIELTVFADNAPAVRLYERRGFAREGLMRAYAFRDGRFVDALPMARLRPGFPG